jgi:hypothetical protein
MFTLVLAASLGTDPAPQFSVENKCHPQFTVTNKCPCDTCDCSGSGVCKCVNGCKCPSCPALDQGSKPSAKITVVRPVVPRVTHTSPDGTVTELWSDGTYRPIPGQKVEQVVPGAVESLPPVATPQSFYVPQPFGYAPNCLPGKA